MAKRKLIQFLISVLYNANLSGFINGKIYRGPIKCVCVPGLNCYSCPGALGACPLGALQSSLSGVVLKIPFYVLGILCLFGISLGRLICGWACPFGLVQDLLYKIPSPKLKKNQLTKKLSILKYIIAIVFILLLPLYFFVVDGVGLPAFCKYICPAGTLEAALPLAIANKGIRDLLGSVFFWKLTILTIIIFVSVFVYRPFCRFICPLGAFYGLFSKLSFYGVIVDDNKCIGCDKCIQHCLMDCKKVGDRECINCGECDKVCPTKAIKIAKKY